jgi:putative transposase
VIKTFKYRIESSNKTLTTANEWLRLCCDLYNACLQQRVVAYKSNKKVIHCFQQQKELTQLKKEVIEYKSVGSQVLQDVIERLDKTFYMFLSKVGRSQYKSGYPRYKSYNRYNSFTLKNCGWVLTGKYLDIYNLGRFKLRLSREIIGNIKTVTIIKSNIGKWYACFACDCVDEVKLSDINKEVGIDLGIKSFIVDSDCNIVENPKYLINAGRKIVIKHNVVNRRVKGSNRRIKSRIILSKLHEKVYNQRKDFIHKLSTFYIRNYDKIYVEDLNIIGMVKNRRLSQSISDSGWGKFIRYLEYKAEEAGRQVIKIPRFEPSSKTCSVCGSINDNLKLSDRQWLCENCGTLHDRDLNAAKNIKRVGQTHQALTKENTLSVA